MDPFEEFEFKPLTDGLGFHNRTTSPPAPHSQSTIQAPLPRREERLEARREYTPPTPVNSTVDEILKTLGERKKYDFNEPTASQMLNAKADPTVYASSSFELSAGLLDGMLIIASYLAALIVVLVVTKVDLFGNLLNPDEQGSIYLSLTALFASLAWIYLVANRLFLGFTPGEWVFDQRLGTPSQLGSASYSLRVAVRSVVLLGTGFFLIPLISMIGRRDFLGKALGVELVKKA